MPFPLVTSVCRSRGIHKLLFLTYTRQIRKANTVAAVIEIKILSKPYFT